MSKPSPNRPQIRMRFMVVGENPRWGRTKGAAISPRAVRASTMKGRLGFIGRLGSFAARRAEKAIRPEDQHERHRHEQHDIGVSGIEHRGDADDLAGYESAEDCAWEGADAANDHDDE